MITTNSKSSKDLFIDVTGMEMLPVTILGDYRENGASGVIDVGCFSAEETKTLNENGIAFINSIGDSWKNSNASGSENIASPACSCVFKKLDDGKVVMGRNMDLPDTFAPAVIFRTKGNGKDTYDTVNIGYTAPGAISFDQIKELGSIPKKLFNIMYISACDALNSEGLYLQYNMRECADCTTSSTNSNSDKRVATVNLIRVLIDRCANIDEVLEYVKTLDIYDPKTPTFDWSMAIGMMDKNGKYGVLEFVNNEIVWNEGRPGFASGQCNFYWSKNASKRFGSGVGRWRKIMEQYYGIESQEDMEKVMKSIRYSDFFTDGTLTNDWKVDWITEVNDKIPYFVANRLKMIYDWRDNYGITIDEKLLKLVLEIEEREKTNNGEVWSAEFLNNPANFYDVVTFMDLFISCFRQLPVDAQKLTGYMECSDIGYTANNKELGYINHFFEMNDVYHIGLYETTIDRVPTDKKLGNA